MSTTFGPTASGTSTSSPTSSPSGATAAAKDSRGAGVGESLSHLREPTVISLEGTIVGAILGALAGLVSFSPCRTSPVTLTAPGITVLPLPSDFATKETGRQD